MNKKYDMKLNECKELRGELLNSQQLLENAERETHGAEVEIRKSKQQLLRVK